MSGSASGAPRLGRDRTVGASAGARRGRQSPLLHLRIERDRLLEWPDAQLLAQRADAAAVLLQRARAVPGPAVEPDQLAMRGLMDGIDLEPPLRVLDGAVVLAAGDQAPRPDA